MRLVNLIFLALAVLVMSPIAAAEICWCECECPGGEDYDVIIENGSATVIPDNDDPPPTNNDDDDDHKTERTLVIRLSSTPDGNVVTVTSGYMPVDGANVVVENTSTGDTIFCGVTGEDGGEGQVEFEGCGCDVTISASKRGYESRETTKSLVACEEPEKDSDGDGIMDSEDECPEEPENYNDFEDEDGCSDELPSQEGGGTGDVIPKEEEVPKLECDESGSDGMCKVMCNSDEECQDAYQTLLMIAMDGARYEMRCVDHVCIPVQVESGGAELLPAADPEKPEAVEIDPIKRYEDLALLWLLLMLLMIAGMLFWKRRRSR